MLLKYSQQHLSDMCPLEDVLRAVGITDPPPPFDPSGPGQGAAGSVPNAECSNVCKTEL